ncbi:hypothetical protein [Calothrix sp. UHCC 0171]|uniref:hypothetical protein n=1 Tax=Calothrix sp. UHCC 0171 TaxID=3110245 RepID=UPI002B1F5CDE|nr:hypothetical protein [Calothrix sp. UHCC 0171]MEA5574610.1 hypothetical protein [Calothrix sp. UHCC 0171]
MNQQRPNLKPVVKQLHAPKSEYVVTNSNDEIDTESLETLIQNLPKTRIRTAARRLGIANKVDGRYEKVAVLQYSQGEWRTPTHI